MTEKNDFTIDNPIMYDKENGRCRCIPIPYEKDMVEKRFENRLDLLNPKFNTLNPVWDNEKGDALNVFEMIDELNYLNDCCNNLIDDNTEYVVEINQMHKENEQLKSTIKEVTELLSDEVDLFSDKATEHDINAYMELKELDNKDAYYMATATKKAIRMLKELKDNV